MSKSQGGGENGVELMGEGGERGRREKVGYECVLERCIVDHGGGESMEGSLKECGGFDVLSNVRGEGGGIRTVEDIYTAA